MQIIERTIIASNVPENESPSELFSSLIFWLESMEMRENFNLISFVIASHLYLELLDVRKLIVLKSL